MLCPRHPWAIACLLLLSIAALLPASGQAAGPPFAWQKARIPVWGDEHVGAMVAEFNAALPRRGPTLVWRQSPLAPCPANPANPAKGRIVFCLLADDVSDYGRTNYRTGQDRSLVAAWIGIHPGTSDDPTLLCHEMMHALTGIPDRYGSQPGQSCIYDEAPRPGTWDVALLASVYGPGWPDQRDGNGRRSRHR